MPTEKAGLLLRLPPRLKAALDRCARHNFRSTNKQAEAIIHAYLARAGFLEKEDGAGEGAPAPSTTEEDETS